nr:hypothetical protein [Mycoplasmopsis bovis]
MIQNKIVGKTDAEPFRSDYISYCSKDGDAWEECRIVTLKNHSWFC